MGLMIMCSIEEGFILEDAKYYLSAFSQEDHLEKKLIRQEHNHLVDILFLVGLVEQH